MINQNSLYEELQKDITAIGKEKQEIKDNNNWNKKF